MRQWHNPKLKRKDYEWSYKVIHGFQISNVNPALFKTCGVTILVRHILTECHKYIKELEESKILTY